MSSCRHGIRSDVASAFMGRYRYDLMRRPRIRRVDEANRARRRRAGRAILTMVKVATYFAMTFGAFLFWQSMEKLHVWIALHQDEKVGLPFSLALSASPPLLFFPLFSPDLSGFSRLTKVLTNHCLFTLCRSLYCYFFYTHSCDC